MNKLISLMKSLRLSVSIPAGLLAHVSYVLNSQTTDWKYVIFFFLLCGTTMVQNDWFDRHHDANKKNKKFVLNNESLVLSALWILWISTILIEIFFLGNHFFNGALLICCFLYSFSRYVLLLAWLLVGVISASPLMVPVLIGQGCVLNILCFIGILFLILGRELLKDLEDSHIDVGYKKTMFADKHNHVSLEQGSRIFRVLVSMGFLMLLFVFYKWCSFSIENFTEILVRTLMLSISGLFIIRAIISSYRLLSIGKTKKYIDIAALFFLLTFT